MGKRNKGWCSMSVFLPAICFSFSCAAQDFILKGYITRLPDSTVIYLSKVDNGLKNIDSAIMINGCFSFAGKTDNNPTLHYIRVRNKFSPLVGFYPEKGTIRIEGVLYGEVKASGTPLNAAYMEYLNTVQRTMEQLTAAYQKMVLQAGDLSASASASRKRYDSLKVAVVSNTLAFVKKYRKTVVAVHALKANAAEMTPGQIEKGISQLHSFRKDSKEITALKRRVVNMRRTEPGTYAPDFILPDADNNLVAFQQLKGKYVLLDFWASWCVPCRNENPNLIKAYDTFKSRNFELLGISLDRTKAPWLKALKEDAVPWLNVLDLKGEAAALYGIETIPYNVLINPSGKIIAVKLRGQQLHTTLDMLLPEKM